MFDAAKCHLHYDVIMTERRNHAHDYVKEMQPGRYDAVVAVSGDGLLHEIVNGFM